MRLIAVVLAMLLVSFVGTAFAAHCPAGASAHDSASAADCCADAPCIGDACLAGAEGHDCDLGARSTALQPLAGELKKFHAQGTVSAVPAIAVPLLVRLAQPPAWRAGPVRVGRYADTYARTGRLLI